MIRERIRTWNGRRTVSCVSRESSCCCCTPHSFCCWRRHGFHAFARSPRRPAATAGSKGRLLLLLLLLKREKCPPCSSSSCLFFPVSGFSSLSPAPSVVDRLSDTHRKALEGRSLRKKREGVQRGEDGKKMTSDDIEHLTQKRYLDS